MKYMKFVRSVPNQAVKRVYLLTGENETVGQDIQNLVYRKASDGKVWSYRDVAVFVVCK